MTAKVLIEYTIKNVCNKEDYGQSKPHKTFESLVKWLIKQEGIHGISEDKFKIVSIKNR